MRLIRAIVIAVLACVVILAGAVFFLPGDRIARIAADQIRARTGRAVTFSGETRITYWPVLGVTTGPVEVANADWSGNGPMFRAQGLRIGVETAALWGGAVRITELEAQKPEILLERNKQGRANWDFGTTGGSGTKGAGTGGSAPAARDVSLGKARITGAKLTILDAQAGTRQVIEGVDLALDWPDAAGPMTFDATLRPAGEAVRAKGRLAAVLPLLDGKPAGLLVDVTAPGGKVHFEGQVSPAPMARGKVDADLSDTAAFAKALGAGPMNLPQGLGRRAKVAGDLSFDGERVAFTDGRATLDNNTLAVTADATLGGTPRVKASVSAGALDLSALGGNSAGGTGGGAASSGWSKAPIDASGLSAIDGEIAFAAGSIDLGTLRLTDVKTVTTIDRARAVTSIRKLSAFGGTATGDVVVNNRKGLSMAGDLKVASVDLQKLLTDMAGIERLTGSADARVKFLASGGSMAALMNSMSGDGSVTTGRGTIKGIDLDQLFRTGQGTGGTTIFDSLTATWTMENGDLFNRDLDMKLASIEAKGEGRIGIGARDIDYLFTPISLKSRDGRGIAVPVRIKGPWSGPRILPDLEKAIQLNFDKEKKALEQKARDEVQKKLGEKLNIQPQDGETPQDLLKRKLQEEAVKGLGRLLGGN